MVKSLEINGQRAPVYVRENEGFEIVDGEQRWRGMKKLKSTQILIYNFGVMADKEARELTVWFQQQVPFDPEREARFVLDFVKEYPDFKLPYNKREILKFEEFFIGKTKEDDSSYLGDGDVKSKLGEVYALGNHRLICGDSTDPEVYERLFMGGAMARLIYTDPPYNVGYDYTVTQVAGRKRKSQHKAFDDSKGDDEFITFLSKAFASAFDHTTDDASFYCWHAAKTQDIFKQAIEKAGFRVSQTIYWLKDRPT